MGEVGMGVLKGMQTRVVGIRYMLHPYIFSSNGTLSLLPLFAYFLVFPSLLHLSILYLLLSFFIALGVKVVLRCNLSLRQ